MQLMYLKAWIIIEFLKFFNLFISKLKSSKVIEVPMEISLQWPLMDNIRLIVTGGSLRWIQNSRKWFGRCAMKYWMNEKRVLRRNEKPAHTRCRGHQHPTTFWHYSFKPPSLSKADSKCICLDLDHVVGIYLYIN